MTNPVSWLSAQLDADEWIAKGAARRSGGADSPPHVDGDGRWFPAGLESRYDARVDDHIVRQDPAHVLRTVAAHRAILNLALATEDRSLHADAWWVGQEMIRQLVSIYEGRDGWDPAWKVEA